MKQYRVTWEIDIDAPTAKDAARQALRIQRDSDSMATEFTVTEFEENEAIGLPEQIEVSED